MRVFGGTFSHFRSKRLHNLGDKWGGGYFDGREGDNGE